MAADRTGRRGKFMSEQQRQDERRADCGDCLLGRALPGPCQHRDRLVPKNTWLWSEGQRAERVVHIRSGMVGLSSTDREGRRQASVVRGPGAVLGLEHLAEPTALFNAQTLTDSHLCEVPVRDLETLSSSRPELQFELLRLTVREVAQLLRERREAAAPAVVRVARYLLGRSTLDPLAQGLGKAGLAQALNMQPETLSRVISDLRAQGLITKKLEVLDKEGLRRLLLNEDD